jgi:hypothetical protein
MDFSLSLLIAVKVNTKSIPSKPAKFYLPMHCAMGPENEKFETF